MAAPSEALMQKEASVQTGDHIAETAAQVEKLSKEEAFDLVLSLSDDADFSDFKLGGVLSVIQSNNWWKDEGFETFKSFIEIKFGIQYRKAMYLINIYNGLVDADVPWDAVKHLGWTKLKELADILNKDNYAEWVKIAEGKTVLQLREYIKDFKKGTLQKLDAEEEQAPSGVTTLTFKVHQDQKQTIKDAVEKAKEEADTDVDAVALEAICMNYLAGGKSVKVASLADLMKKHTPEEVLEQFETVYPDYNITVTVNS